MHVVSRALLLGAFLRPCDAWCSAGDIGDCFLTIRAGDTPENAVSAARGVQFVHTKNKERKEEVFGYIAATPSDDELASAEIKFALGGETHAKIHATGTLATRHLVVGDLDSLQENTTYTGRLNAPNSSQPAVLEVTGGPLRIETGEDHIQFSKNGVAASWSMGLGSGGSDDFSISRGKLPVVRMASESPRDTLVISSDGNMGVGTRWPMVKLDVNGGVQGTSAYSSASDRRWKKNITYANEGMLEGVKALAPVSYNFRADEFPTLQFETSRQIGFIAQEVEKVFPEVVTTNSHGFKSVKYGLLTPVLSGAIRELSDQTDLNHKECIDSVKRLEERIKELEHMIESLVLSQVT